MKKNNIILIGMPAAGKSTIGIILAKKLGYDFIDTDLLIQKTENALLREIIAKKGIEAFLEIENRVNLGVDVQKTVIAPGGSVIYCKEAMEHFKKLGIIIYLKVPFEIIKKRIPDPEKRGVVLAPGQSLFEMYVEREELFEKYADMVLCQSSVNIEDCIEEILEHVREKMLPLTGEK